MPVLKKSLKLFKRIFFLLCISNSVLLTGQVANPTADAAITAFNNAFLVTSGGRTYYKKALNDTGDDGTWTLALDILGMQDAYERTGSATYKSLINSLCTSFLQINPPPYNWDGWNDDLAWMGLALARGYQITGNSTLLSPAEGCFNLAYNRGWNTIFNDGGIWEQQPDMTPFGSAVSKEALSNNPNGHLACLLYQSTGKSEYKNKAIQIYNWSRSHIFNPGTGQVYTGIDRNDAVNMSTAVYNQGSFIDFANELYKITGKESVLRDAQLAADYVIKNMTTNGVLNNTADYLNTWADTYVRGVGHLCMTNPQMWNTYYSFLKRNADAAWANRRTDLNLCWNGWAVKTPLDASAGPTKYVSAAALHQFTPTVQTIPDTIEAENYNFMKGVSVTSITAGGKSVGAIDAGDWVEYIVKVPTTGNYTISCTVAGTSNGSMQVQQNDIAVSTIDLPNTGNLQSYSTVSSTIKLSPGTQSIKLKAVTGGWAIDKFIIQNCQLIVPAISVNDGVSQQITSVVLNVGDKVTINPAPIEGTWNWTGPNGFTSTSAKVSIADIQLNQGGIYTAKYISPDGCISIQDFKVALNSCSPTSIVPYVQINDSAAQQMSVVTLKAGDYLNIDPQPAEGIWRWTGPNGFSSNNRKISILSITNRQSGNYTATYTNSNGCSSTQVVSITVTGSDPAAKVITPYASINGAAWQQINYAAMTIGGRITVGPQPADGSWSWTGPGGFTSKSREFTINPFKATQAGTYSATYTNAAGLVSKGDFIMGLKNCTATPITPEIQVNGQPWTNTDVVDVASGADITITPPSVDGIWNWTGPNGFTSNSRQLILNNVLNRKAGKYIATFINADGCQSTYSLVVNVSGNDFCGTPTISYVNVNGLGWQQSALVSLKSGNSLSVGPQASVNGTWLWSGPDGFTAARRDFTLSSVTVAQAGTYFCVFTNSSGCESYVNLKVTVDGVSAVEDVSNNSGLQLFPNPATDKVTLRTIPANTPVSILDLSGRVLLLMQSSDKAGDTTIDVNGLNPGVYFVKVGGAQSRSFKLIKQ